MGSPSTVLRHCGVRRRLSGQNGVTGKGGPRDSRSVEWERACCAACFNHSYMAVVAAMGFRCRVACSDTLVYDSSSDNYYSCREIQTYLCEDTLNSNVHIAVFPAY